jgi:hypothetical protein
VAILVANAYGAPFDAIRVQTFERNWGRLRKEGIDVFLLSGQRCSPLESYGSTINEKIRHSNLGFIQRVVNRHINNRSVIGIPTILVGNEIQVQVPDTLQYLLHKVISGFFLLQDYDFIFKTTLSSVVHVENFIHFVEGIEESNPVIAGTLHEFPRYTLVSGSNLLLNKIAVTELLERANDLDQGFLDDVAVSKLLAREFETVSLSSINLGDFREIDLLSRFELEETIHFRCRSNQVPREDIAIIEKLIKVIEHQ